MVSDPLIKQTAELIRQSRFLTVLTGAGVSKESGIPTFRDALEGLWAQYDPRQLATPFAFAQNPKLVWDFYEFRRDLMRPAEPNPGHYALADIQRRVPDSVIITQNIDDLHERAGSTSVIHLHGLIAQNKCSANCQGDPTLVDVTVLNGDREDRPPKCPHCGRFVRPNVVWFGELLPCGALMDAHDALAQTDVMLVVGTSGVVMPAAEMPLTVKRRGASVIEVNPCQSDITSIADVWLSGASGDVLPRLLEALDAKV